MLKIDFHGKDSKTRDNYIDLFYTFNFVAMFSKLKKVDSSILMQMSEEKP